MRGDIQKGNEQDFNFEVEKVDSRKVQKVSLKKRRGKEKKKSKSIEMTTTYILLLQNIRYVYNSMR